MSKRLELFDKMLAAELHATCRAYRATITVLSTLEAQVHVAWGATASARGSEAERAHGGHARGHFGDEPAAGFEYVRPLRFADVAAGAAVLVRDVAAFVVAKDLVDLRVRVVIETVAAFSCLVVDLAAVDGLFELAARPAGHDRQRQQ